MRKVNKLVAVLLAAVMVLGMLPGMTVHAHEHDHAVAPQAIEDYPEITLDTEYTATIAEIETLAYFRFTPTATDSYTFYSAALSGDTMGYLFDSDLNELVANDDGGADYGRNFAITYVLEAGTTYVFGARYYSTWNTGSFPVWLTTSHSYISEVTTEPTCTSEGVLTYTCEHCGDSYTETLPAVHSYGDDGRCIHCGTEYMITGTCGDDLTWKLDYFGNMTISGTGAMYDYAYSYSDTSLMPPWYTDYRMDIKNLVVEEGATSIGVYAFYGCSELTSASLPSTLQTIGDNAFRDTSLTSVVVPEGVTSIGYTAFGYVYELESVSLPSTLTTLGQFAFYNCTVLDNVVIPDSVTSIGNGTFRYCANLTNVTLPAGLTEIPASMFSNCGSLTDITWPENLETIGASAFYYCNGLTDLVIPEGVTTLGESAFNTCDNLASVTLPSTLTDLGYSTFGYDYKLKKVVFTGDLPASINASAFNYVTADAYYPSGNETWTTDALQNYGGTLTWHALCVEHTFSDWSEATEATCTQPSVKTRTCTVEACGWTETEVLAPALGHSYTAEVTPPTCEYYGYTTYTCTVCGDTYTDDYVWSEGHQYAEEVVEPTCGSEGYTIYTCTVCGSTYNANYTDPLEHTLGEWSEPTEATCTEDGVKTATCSVCGQTVTEVVTPALGHTWGEEGVENADGSVTYTCTVCGDTYSTEAQYLSLGDNTVVLPEGDGTEKTKTYTAEQDGNLIITVTSIKYYDEWAYEYTGEYWTEIPLDRAFDYSWYTLTVNGELVEYSNTKTVEVAAGDVVSVQMHNYYYYESQAVINLAYEGAAHEHVWSDWTVTTPATCTTEGEQTRSCECGETETEVIPAAGHTWDEGVVTEPTCDEPGYTTYTCTVCGATDVPEDSTTEPLDHDWQSVVTEPTCTEQGYTTWTCARCNDSYVDEDSYTDALGHSYESVVTEPTCTEGGYTTHTCSVCSDSYTDAETEPTGHSWKGLKCENCDATRENPFVDVPEDAFYLDPVLWAVEKGITTGADATHFNPNGKCQRAAVVTFLWRAAGSPEPTTTGNPFDDVKESDFYYKAVLWAVETGVTNGTSATTFSPMEYCSRAQVVTFLWRAMGEPASDAEVSFSDVKEGLFYTTAVKWAVETGVTNGMGDGIFGVNETCNRAQVVTFLYRAYN